jgi:DNA repair protein RadC
MTSGIIKGENMTSLQERFIRSGFGSLTDQETIELLLSLALPSHESKKKAKECMESFNNLRGFLSASRQELEQVGITPPCMLYIKLLHELPAEVLRQKIVE